MRRTPALALRIALAAALAPAARAAAAPAAVRGDAHAFVIRDGAHFAAEGRRFRFLGANLSVMSGAQERARYADTLAAAARDGLRVGRVWALGSSPTPAGARDDLLWIGGSRLNEPAAEQLDRVLAEARRDGLRLIVVLANRWPDYGGVPEVLRELSLPWEDDQVFGATDRFYSDVRARALYQARLDTLLARVNTVTHVAYRDDPTIFAWELMNESDAADEDGARARLDWIDTMARHVKQLDPHHLVSAGVFGYDGPETRRWWLDACALPSIDYCDAHLYAEDDAAVTGEEALRRAIDDRVALAHAGAGKPIVLGELGFRTRGPLWHGRTAAGWASVAVEELARDAADGALVWIYQPYTGAPRGDSYGIYVDHPSTAALRAALARGALRLGRSGDVPSNHLVADARPDAPPLFDETVHLRGSARAGLRSSAWTRARDGTLRIQLPVGAFASAASLDAGRSGSTPLEEVYGAGSGLIAYALPPVPPSFPGQARIEVRARLSSEYPGSVAPENGFSTVDVRLDGETVGRALVPPDDGRGRWLTVRAAIDVGPGVHRLVLAVEPGPLAHGLCLYGAPTGKGAVPPGGAGGVQATLSPPAATPTQVSAVTTPR